VSQIGTALAVTLAIEVPLVAILFRGQRARMAAVAVLTNTATNLTLNLVFARMPALAGVHLLLGEVFAAVVETAAYALASRPRNLALSALASGLGNALSFGAGLVGLPQYLFR
jgi:hypothetical protein